MGSAVPIKSPVREQHAQTQFADCTELTLLELVRAVSEETENDTEVVETVLQLLRSGRVHLCGNFRDHVPSADDVWMKIAAKH